MGPGAGRWSRDGCCFEPAWRTLKQSLSGRGLAILMVSWCGFASPYYFEAHSNIVPIVAGLMVMTVSWNRTRHLSWACSHLCSWSFRQGWTQVTQMGLKINWDTSKWFTWSSFASSKQIQWDKCALNHDQPARGLWTTWSSWYKPPLRIHLAVATVKSQVAPLPIFSSTFVSQDLMGLYDFMLSCFAHKGLKESPRFSGRGVLLSTSFFICIYIYI